MKVTNENICGKVIKDNETYLLEDNNFLKNLVVSKTTLHPNKTTRGHYHKGNEEVYSFLSGSGIMVLGETEIAVEAGNIVLIEDGIFHQVKNTSDSDELVFLSIFERYER